jgi:predicted TIM-barrel fold metal-dependent hydrolase
MAKKSCYEVPVDVRPVFGSILDIDGHENIPPNHWVGEFGHIAKEMCEALEVTELEAKICNERDDTEISQGTVFTEKWAKAPGAFDLKRRLEVLDFIGIERQMLYPGLEGLFSLTLYLNADDPKLFVSIRGDRRAYARKMLDAYNDWCMRTSRFSDRLRPVAIMMGETLEEILREARKLADGGVRGFWFPSARPIAGMSPADTRLDSLWSLMESAGIACLDHISGDPGFLRTAVWRDAPAFHGWKAGNEFQLDPWTLSTFHFASQNFVTCMVLGGVFDRFPKLAFGAAEVCAHWIGPLAQQMDLWHANNRKFRQLGGSSPLRMKPSEYMRRNVRVSPYDIEDIATYIDQFGMEEVYCFTADFPHAEGGRRPIEDFSDNLKRLGPDVIRKFFVDNPVLLLSK